MHKKGLSLLGYNFGELMSDLICNGPKLITYLTPYYRYYIRSCDQWFGNFDCIKAKEFSFNYRSVTSNCRISAMLDTDAVRCVICEKSLFTKEQLRQLQHLINYSNSPHKDCYLYMRHIFPDAEHAENCNKAAIIELED